jgi:hypothetical protein
MVHAAAAAAAAAMGDEDDEHDGRRASAKRSSGGGGTPIPWSLLIRIISTNIKNASCLTCCASSTCRKSVISTYGSSSISTCRASCMVQR